MSARRALVGYLAAQAVSLAGTRLSMIAVPWFVLTETGSAALTGLVTFAEMAPLVVCQALSGPFTDRLGARRVAIGCDLASVVVVGLVPVLHLLGLLHLGVLLGLVAVAGSLRGPAEAAKHTLIPDVVEASGATTDKVAGLEGAVERAASMAGAAAAAGVVAVLGAANALVLDAASFLVSAGLLAVALPRRARPRDPVAREPYLRELRTGWTFMRKDPVLLGIGVLVAVTNLLDQSYGALLLPVWARDSGNGVAAVGLLGAVNGASAVLGSIVAASYVDRLPRLPVFVAGFVIGGVPRFVLLGLDAPLWTVVAVLVVGGVGIGFLNPILATVLFERTPEGLRGRVSSMNIAMSWSLIPFGGLLGGALVSGLGLSPALLAVGAAYLIVTTLPAVLPSWRGLGRAPVAGSTGAPAHA